MKSLLACTLLIVLTIFSASLKAQDMSDAPSTNFELVYTDLIDPGLSGLEQMLAQYNDLAMQTAEQKCGGAALKISEETHVHPIPWTSLVRITFIFSCVR